MKQMQRRNALLLQEHADLIDLVSEKQRQTEGAQSIQRAFSILRIAVLPYS